MQITTETLDRWLRHRASAEFASDKNGAFTHRLERTEEGIQLVTTYRDNTVTPRTTGPFPDTWKLKKLVLYFCDARGAKPSPESFTWGDGIWIQS